MQDVRKISHTYAHDECLAHLSPADRLTVSAALTALDHHLEEVLGPVAADRPAAALDPDLVAFLSAPRAD